MMKLKRQAGGRATVLQELNAAIVTVTRVGVPVRVQANLEAGYGGQFPIDDQQGVVSLTRELLQPRGGRGREQLQVVAALDAENPEARSCQFQ